MIEKGFAVTIQAEKFSPLKMLYSTTQPCDCSMPASMNVSTEERKRLHLLYKCFKTPYHINRKKKNA